MSVQETSQQICIIGGGFAGLASALALADAGAQVTVLEVGNPVEQQAPAFDGRVSALARGSVAMLERWGVWQHLAPHAGPIRDIRITDNHSPFFLHYDAALVPDEVGEISPMGYIVENRHLRQALWQPAQAHPRIIIHTETCVAMMEMPPQQVALTLENGDRLEAALVVAADGRGSHTRTLAGVGVTRKDYHQTAIVCTVRHELPHDGLAVEHFLPAGPFAILPMFDPHLSSLVWSEKTALAPYFLAMEDGDFLSAIQRRFGDFLGEVSLHGPRWSYPLSLQLADTMIAPRLALVGDAAHGIHPISGQGYNLGLRDIALLEALVAQQIACGLDVGSGQMLAEYARGRAPDIRSMVMITDAINALFSNDNSLLSAARKFGLAAVQHFPPLKRFFMRHAMGQFKW